MSGSIPRIHASNPLKAPHQEEDSVNEHLSGTNAKIYHMRGRIDFQRDTPEGWKFHKFFHVKKEENCFFCFNAYENQFIDVFEERETENEPKYEDAHSVAHGDNRSEVSFIVRSSVSGEIDDLVANEFHSEIVPDSLKENTQSDTQSMDSVPATEDLALRKDL